MVECVVVAVPTLLFLFFTPIRWLRRTSLWILAKVLSESYKLPWLLSVRLVPLPYLLLRLQLSNPRFRRTSALPNGPLEDKPGLAEMVHELNIPGMVFKNVPHYDKDWSFDLMHLVNNGKCNSLATEFDFLLIRNVTLDTWSMRIFAISDFYYSVVRKGGVVLIAEACMWPWSNPFVVNSDLTG